jgi:hypothetical protein
LFEYVGVKRYLNAIVFLWLAVLVVTSAFFTRAGFDVASDVTTVLFAQEVGNTEKAIGTGAPAID